MVGLVVALAASVIVLLLVGVVPVLGAGSADAVSIAVAC